METAITITPFDLVQEKFPKSPGILMNALEGQASWIRWRLKPIIELCISIFHNDHGTRDKNENRHRSQDILRFLNMLDDYVWEHLNIGHWKNIPHTWRRLKSVISLLRVATHVAFDDHILPEEIIKICDQGLLLGSPGFLENILAVLAERLHSMIPERQASQKSSLDTKLKSPTLVRLDGPQFVVPRLTNPPVEIFLTQHFNLKRPVILTNTIDSWPAKKRWNPEYIVTVGGARTVPVEIGSKYTSEDWTQKLMTIQEFVSRFMTTDDKVETGKGIGYLAQYQLFDQLPELRRDIMLPDYCFVGEETESEDNVEINAWFGPAYTLTPAHYDAKHNLLAQVFGTKFVRLFPPEEAGNLYPHNSESLLFNTSSVDLEDPLVSDRFPNIRNARYSDLYLSPGEVLYIPPKWWHAVQSLTPSFSVSFWFQ